MADGTVKLQRRELTYKFNARAADSEEMCRHGEVGCGVDARLNVQLIVELMRS